MPRIRLGRVERQVDCNLSGFPASSLLSEAPAVARCAMEICEQSAEIVPVCGRGLGFVSQGLIYRAPSYSRMVALI